MPAASLPPSGARPGSATSEGAVEAAGSDVASELSLMCVLAHPDDESMGVGGILAKDAAEGITTHVVVATRGERGWRGDPADNPGPEALGRLREAELRAAATRLGVRRVEFLDDVDGDVDRAEPTSALAKVVRLLREIRPHVVVTFAPDGAYGHPDHIAISQLTTAAIVAAADSNFAGASGRPPHRVAKLSAYIVTRELADAYIAAFGDIAITVDGVERGAMIWPDWAATTRIDCADHWRTVWQAIRCHRSQLPNLDVLDRLPESAHRALWGRQEFYRVDSLVNGGRAVEDDLFTGLR